MKTKLIFVRHGFSTFNKQNLFAGITDAPLTDIGLLQAERAADYLKNIHIDIIYSSPLQRAYSTAVPIAKSHGLEIVKAPGVCEINGGSWEGVSFSELGKDYPKEFETWKSDFYNCRCPNGESMPDFVNRIYTSVLKIAKENPGKTVCITTHATPIRVISCFALGVDIQRLGDVAWTPNASINILEFEDNKFSFLEKDITSHLEDIKTFLPDL